MNASYGPLHVTSDTPVQAHVDESLELLTRKFQRELSAGLTALVLLAILADAESDLYGYEIARRLAGDQEVAGPFKLGALYPVLRNLCAAGRDATTALPPRAAMRS
jgi:PadR family transcriptional regulator, regulatory protein PadR